MKIESHRNMTRNITLALGFSHRWRHRVWPALIAIAFAACSGSDPIDNTNTNDIYEAEPFPNTLILEATTLNALRASDADGTLHFSGTPTALSGVTEGNVILAGISDTAPAGLLRYVLAVEEDAQGLVLKTTEAPIQFAFRKLNVSFSRHVGDEDNTISFQPISETTTALTQSLSGSFWPSVNLDEYAFNGDNDPKTPLDQVHVTGKLSGGLDYTFTINVDWGDVLDLPDAISDCVKEFFMGSFNCSLQVLMPEAKVGFSFKPGANAELGLEGVAFLGYERDITVAKAKLKPVPIGPLWFFPEIDIRAGISGKASSQFRLSTKASISAETKISYSNKHGGTLTPPKIEKSFEAPTVEASLGASAKLRIGPRLTVTLFQITGIFASLYAAAEIEADQQASPCWHLYGGVEGDAGFLIKSPDIPLLGSVTVASFEKEFDIVKSEIGSGSCKIPTNIGPTPTGGDPETQAFTNPKFDPWAKIYPDIVDGFPHEGPTAQNEWAQLTPTIDGRFMLTGSDTNALLKLDPLGTPIWGKRYVADVTFWKDTLNPDLLPGRVVNAKDGAMFVVAHPYTLLKVSASGRLLWAKRFNVGENYRESWLRFSDAISDGNGGIYLTGTYGTTPFTPLDTADMWLLRIDAKGSVLWSKRIGASESGDVARRLIAVDDGVVVVGMRLVNPGTKWHGTVSRYKADGTFVWGRDLVADDCGGGYEQQIYPIAGLRSRDGDLIIGGGIQHSGFESVIFKMKPDGALSWVSIARATETSHLGPTITELVELPTSGYLATGFYSGKGTHEDIFLASLDAVGKVHWSQLYGGTENPQNALASDDNYPTVQLTKDGGALVAAYSEAILGEDSLWTMKLPAKNGTIAFNSSSSVKTEPLALTLTEQTCVVANAWAPTTESLDLPLIPMNVTTESLTVSSTSLTP